MEFQFDYKKALFYSRNPVFILAKIPTSPENGFHRARCNRTLVAIQYSSWLRFPQEVCDEIVNEAPEYCRNPVFTLAKIPTTHKKCPTCKGRGTMSQSSIYPG